MQPLNMNVKTCLWSLVVNRFIYCLMKFHGVFSSFPIPVSFRDKSIQTFNGHRGKEVNAIFFDELRIASAAEDNKIRIWDFNV